MTQRSSVGVVDKTAVVLECLARGPASLAELVERSGLSRPTAYRLAVALEVHRLVTRDGAGRFTLGPMIDEPGARRRPGPPRTRRPAGARPALPDDPRERAALPKGGRRPTLHRRVGAGQRPARHRSGRCRSADDSWVGRTGAPGVGVVGRDHRGHRTRTVLRRHLGDGPAWLGGERGRARGRCRIGVRARVGPRRARGSGGIGVRPDRSADQDPGRLHAMAVVTAARSSPSRRVPSLRTCRPPSPPHPRPVRHALSERPHRRCPQRIATARPLCRWLPASSTGGCNMPRRCSVRGCERKATERGWCHGHYLRWVRLRDVQADRPLGRRVNHICSVEDCERPAPRRELRQTHAARLRKFRDVLATKPVRTRSGKGFLSHGYFRVPIPRDLRYLTGGVTPEFEHRFVMAQRLGRPLTPDESVHHKNGDRLETGSRTWSCGHVGSHAASGSRTRSSTPSRLLRRYAPTRRGNISQLDRSSPTKVAPTGFEPALPP